MSKQPASDEQRRRNVANGDTGVSRRSFAEKLAYLYRTAKLEGRGGRPWVDRDLAAAVNALHGTEVISGSYLQYLRTGRRTNPTLNHVQAIAAFFDVPAAYFLPDGDVAERVDAEVQILAARARALSPAGRQQISSMIAFVEQLEREAKRSGGSGHGP
jgi:transcriptional regulator with XRE-family HTH domain